MHLKSHFPDRPNREMPFSRKSCSDAKVSRPIQPPHAHSGAVSHQELRAGRANGGRGFGGLKVAETDGGADRDAPLGSQKEKGVAGVVRRTVVKLRRMFGADLPENTAEAKEAVRHFLAEMNSVAVRTYPGWVKILNQGLGEHELTYDERRALLEIHPIDDYFFAGIVALETARIRGLYTPDEATELLGEIGHQVDAAAGRQDRVVSDLVFLILGRIDLNTGVEHMKAPYDKVVKSILQQIGLNKIDATKGLMADKAFRHMLGEPLALGVPQWWKAFQAKFSLYWEAPEEMDEEETEMALQALAAANAAPARGRRRGRKRASSFLGT